LIRVLLVNDHLGWEGKILHGVARLFLLTIPRYDRSRFSIIPCILRRRDELEQPFLDRGIKLRFLERSRFHPGTLLDLVRLIREERIDVLHVQGYAGSVFGRLAGLVTRKPVIEQCHSVDPHFPFYMHVPDLLLSRSLVTCLTLCETVQRFCRKTRHMPRDRVSRIRLGIDASEFDAPPEEDLERVRRELRLPAREDGRVVGTVTRLFEQKGVAYFLEAAAEVAREEPGTVFVVTGDGPLREDLERRAHELGIDDRVRWLGFRRDVAVLLHLFDVAVISSLWEATPLTALEALAARRPLVTTDVDGLVELVQDGVTGRVVGAADSRALARGILELLRDGTLATTLARKGRETVESRFSVDRYVRDLEAVYRQAAEIGR